MKLFGARAVPAEERGDATPGEVIALGTDVTVKCGEDAVRVAYVQPAGRGRLTAGELARGRGLELGELFAQAGDGETNG